MSGIECQSAIHEHGITWNVAIPAHDVVAQGLLVDIVTMLQLLPKTASKYLINAQASAPKILITHYVETEKSMFMW